MCRFLKKPFYPCFMKTSLKQEKPLAEGGINQKITRQQSSSHTASEVNPTRGSLFEKNQWKETEEAGKQTVVLRPGPIEKKKKAVRVVRGALPVGVAEMAAARGTRM